MGAPKSFPRLPVLDGWRAISILLVLACHLLPLGPKALQLNATAGAAGMAIFFTLSGFLIVNFLADGVPLGEFLTKRVVRIVPLAWLVIILLASRQPVDGRSLAFNLAFFANLPPSHLLHGGEHLWSLGVEMQFYAAAALLCLLGRRALLLIPPLCIAITLARISAGETISIVTWHRVDEILAGGALALAYRRGLVPRLPVVAVGVLLFLCSHPAGGWFLYLRPYAAALMVGATLNGQPRPFMISRPMRYIAEISYALYVIHGVLGATWLGQGAGAMKYLKRLPLLAATFGLAHLSTRYMEQPLNRLARRATKRSRRARRPLLPAEAETQA